MKKWRKVIFLWKLLGWVYFIDTHDSPNSNWGSVHRLRYHWTFFFASLVAQCLCGVSLFNIWIDYSFYQKAFFQKFFFRELKFKKYFIKAVFEEQCLFVLGFLGGI